MLGDFTVLHPPLLRTALLVDSLEGYPIFLPPRSVGQSEFGEALKRLASEWRHGAGGAGGRGKVRLAIELPMEEGQELEPRTEEDGVACGHGSTSTYENLLIKPGHGPSDPAYLKGITDAIPIEVERRWLSTFKPTLSHFASPLVLSQFTHSEPSRPIAQESCHRGQRVPRFSGISSNYRSRHGRTRWRSGRNNMGRLLHNPPPFLS